MSIRGGREGGRETVLCLWHSTEKCVEKVQIYMYMHLYSVHLIVMNRHSSGKLGDL